MKLKSKLLAGTSTLVLAGSMMAAAAPAAHAVVTSAGSCGGSVLLLKIAATAYPGGPVIAKGTGLGDQTAPVKVTGNLAKDQTLKTVIGGVCTGVHSRALDTHVPGGSPATLTLHPTLRGGLALRQLQLCEHPGRHGRRREPRRRRPR